MFPSRRFLVALFIVTPFVLEGISSSAQARVSSQQSVTVDAHLTPQEIEDGQLNDIYQPIYKMQEQHKYEKAIDGYRRVVIPRAESAKFEKPKNKFLYLAYSDLGTCQMALGHFKEAEAMYQKTFDYLPATPGVDDSENAVMFRSVGIARMRQQRWKDAEEPLQKAISVSGEQIVLADKLKEEFMRKALTADYRESQDISLNMLAVDYFRQQRYAEALSLLEQAYHQAVEFQASATVLKQILDSGKVIAMASGNSSANHTW